MRVNLLRLKGVSTKDLKVSYRLGSPYSEFLAEAGEARGVSEHQIARDIVVGHFEGNTITNQLLTDILARLEVIYSHLGLPQEE